MPNIGITHADSGLVRTRVARSERVTPHMHRVTFSGEDLDTFVPLGFDQWFRLAIPVRDGDRLDKVPSKFTFGTLLKFMAMPRGTRPTIRNYTVRDFRPATDGQSAELDVDFVIHGDSGVAGPWAVSAEPGAPVALVDQGCGWKPVPAAQSLIVTDESGMAAALGVLRDMPRDATGHAIIEVFDERDRQDDAAPEGVTVHWLVRKPSDDPGALALPALRELSISADLYAFTVGESALIKGVRRHLVNDCGVPKANVTFSGYWKIGKSAPS
ncbi:siderophore-interacting protein [Corynebacterium nuruki]|jgi:NADPH-dependent ferric siderophore reductase|uniref:Siderophore-interacting protein n=1 Tax=Corynebacterium nuruki TaxID=1032851 RepID=A0A3D4SVW7_9CORY|nr:siderophore-interacting protein [Corynebacterium nuruki]HCT13424.1 siderophore-interacting protein [Corynebacterium nuruki]